MEYRLKYRDVPWEVAIAILPGKMIGTFIIKPIEWIIEEPLRFVMRILQVATAVIILFTGSVLVDVLIFDRSLDISNGLNALLEIQYMEKEIERQRLKSKTLDTVLKAQEEAAKIKRAKECRVKDATGRCR